MADITTLKTRLTEAEEALHQLSIGKQRVSLSKDGTTITFTPATILGLKNYIRSLQQAIARADGGSTRHAWQVTF